MDTRLSVVIVNWNTIDMLRCCLRSLERALDRPSTQVVVVDNDSSDGSCTMVRAAFPWVETISSASNLGFAAGNNLALPSLTGRYLLFLNPDTDVTKQSIDAMLSLLGDRPDVGAVGTTLLNPDGSLQLSCHRFYGFRHSLAHNRLVDRLVGSRELLSVHDAGGPVDVDWMTGACLMVRRSAMDELGGFDPAFFVYGEEVDLQYRLRQLGWRVVYVPSDGVVHHGRQSAGQSPMAASLHDYRGRWLFLRKHYSLASAATYLVKTTVGLVFWMLFWAMRATGGTQEEATRQCRAHWRLLVWHLFDRGMLPIPTTSLGRCGSGPAMVAPAFSTCGRPFPIEETGP